MRLTLAIATVATVVALAGCGGTTNRTSARIPASEAAATASEVASRVATAAAGASPTEPDPTGSLVPANPTPVVQAEFSAPLGLYRVYVDKLLAKLRPQLAALQTAAASGSLSAAEHDWLWAHISWLELGQDDNEYGAFGNLGEQIDGKADGLPGTTSNPSFTGFHKVETDLWQKHDTQAAARDARVLASRVARLTPARVARDLPDTVNSLNAWVLRAHEILEDGLRDSLSQADDYGSNSALTSLAADVEATREMLVVLAQPLEIQSPKILPAAEHALNQLDQAINVAGGPLRSVSLTRLPLRTRLALDQAAGAAVEALAPISELMHDTVPRGDMNIDRRTFLTKTGLGAAVASAAGAGLLGGPGTATAKNPAQSADPGSAALEADAPIVIPRGEPTLPAVPFHGPHQAGIITPKQPAGSFASFDVVAGSRSDLIDALKVLTQMARFLSTGGEAPLPTMWAPPADSGTLGQDVPADGLTVTVGFGSTLFDERFGIATQKPAHLKPMEPFPDDNLDPSQTGGDILIQLCAGNPDTTLHALRQITRATRGALALNWRLDGFVPPPRPSGVPRNTFAFKDGIANPDVEDEAVADRLLWVVDGIGEPAWATGGSYHVIRVIQQFIEFWDRVSLTEQQQMIGRFRESGAPLDGSTEADIPDYKADPDGYIIPLTAHIRLSNPRTPETELNRIYRRGYNYDRGVDLNDNIDVGLVFNCFQQDLDRQFIVNQTRLIGEPMVDYISPIGGGYFFALPGVRDASDWYASRLFA